jgi:hypothetical protein
MLIDCTGCVVRGAACGDCVVGVLLGAPPGGVEIDEAERRALDVLADAGMVPRLRLITERDVRAAPVPAAEALPGTGGPGRPRPAPRARPTRHVA